MQFSKVKMGPKEATEELKKILITQGKLWRCSLTKNVMVWRKDEILGEGEKTKFPVYNCVIKDSQYVTCAFFSKQKTAKSTTIFGNILGEIISINIY